MTSKRRIYFIVPMKDPTEAKTRLRSNLSPEICDALASAMFRRTVEVIRREFPDIPLLVVTRSVRIAALARSLDYRILQEPVAGGLNEAANLAAAWGQSNGFDIQVLVHADLPLIDRQGLELVMRRMDAPEVDVAICRSWSGGTSAIATHGPATLPFCFGPNSYARHLHQARALNLRVCEAYSDQIGMDLDTIDDLMSLSCHPDFDTRLLEGVAG